MEKKHFFSGGQIAGMIFCFLIGIVCTVALIAAQAAKATMPVEVLIPASGLSNSVFDAQNSIYQPDADFPIEYRFEHLSEVVDVPDRQTAAMGNGTFWRIADGFYIYATEGKRAGLADAVFAEATPILLAGAVGENTSGQLVESEKGYLNGREYNYVVFDILCSTDEAKKEAYIIGYLYEDSESGYSVFLSCITDDISTNGLRNAQIVAQKEATLLH